MSEEPQKVTAESGDVSTSTVNVSGRVKWFNNKAGYGFITVTAGSNTDTDVFVHHSAIQVDQEQYRYLVQGEYVMFDLCHVADNDHKWQAGNVKGINNGKLMCETRLESRQVRGNNGEPPPRASRGERGDESSARHFVVKTRGSGPRELDHGDEWMLVRRRPPGSNVRGSGSRPDVLRSRGPPATRD